MHYVLCLFCLFAALPCLSAGVRAALTADSRREITNKLTDDLTIDFVTSCPRRLDSVETLSGTLEDRASGGPPSEGGTNLH